MEKTPWPLKAAVTFGVIVLIIMIATMLGEVLYVKAEEQFPSQSPNPEEVVTVEGLLARVEANQSVLAENVE
jgi:hypothetical protein